MIFYEMLDGSQDSANTRVSGGRNKPNPDAGIAKLRIWDFWPPTWDLGLFFRLKVFLTLKGPTQNLIWLGRRFFRCSKFGRTPWVPEGGIPRRGNVQ